MVINHEPGHTKAGFEATRSARSEVGRNIVFGACIVKAPRGLVRAQYYLIKTLLYGIKPKA
jgi:hypothetical protein